MSIKPVDNKAIFWFIVSLLFLITSLLYLYFDYKKTEFLDSFGKNKERLSDFSQFSEDYLAIKKECSGQKIRDCFKKEEIFNKFNTSQIYSFLAESVLKGEISSSNCHFISHEVGAEAYNKTNLKTVMATSFIRSSYDSNCISGFYHGAIIESAKAHDEGEAELENLFETLQEPKNWAEFEIIHGIGHAFYASLGEIYKAGEKCSSMSKNQKQEYLCLSGVFMQFFMERNNVGLINNISMCKEYNSKYRFACISSYVEDTYTFESLRDQDLPVCLEQDGYVRSVCLEKIVLNMSAFEFGAQEKINAVESIYRQFEYTLDKVDVLSYSSKYWLSSKSNISPYPSFCLLGNALEFYLCYLRFNQIKSKIIFIPKSYFVLSILQ